MSAVTGILRSSSLLPRLLRTSPHTKTVRSIHYREFGYVYDERMLLHDCPYDSTMAEKPERMKLIYERLKKEGQLNASVKIPARAATDEEIALNHPTELIKELEELKTSEDCEEYCRDKEILWLGPHSMEAARLAAGGSIDLVTASAQGRIGNGFAIVRPPGHHAWGKTPQGYCVFNNVAVAAKYAVERLGLKRLERVVIEVAVVDFDIHPGNGTFMSLRGDPRLHFTSFHSYHHGAFWPFLPEFDYDTQKEQLFFPLNGAMNTEGDFLSAFHHVLLPVLREFSPEMIIISAGFDAAYYDIMLEMGQAVKAHGYGHMAAELSSICPDRTVAILEGGYFPHSYVECAHQMVKGLKGDALPSVEYPSRVAGPLAETILNNIHHHSKHWKTMKTKLDEIQTQQKNHGLPQYSPSSRLFIGHGVRDHWEEVKRLRAVRTREWFPPMDDNTADTSIAKIDAYRKEYNYSPSAPPSEGTLLSQLIWDERAKADSYVKSAPPSLFMYNEFYDYLAGRTSNMMICDRDLYAAKKGKQPSK